ncbi:hypothetical protein [Natranaerobius trueperi]|uniref:hypothetical protein n=1 Tax=Natranaerobius trueperi TaxID=759412 RepID=UPI00130371D3|nr:hypothetical protein [Natranaerobius trueperi]
MIEECSLKPVISKNRRNSKKLGENFNEIGIPVCPKDSSLTFKYDGYCNSRKRIKWVCPLNRKQGTNSNYNNNFY